MQQLKPIETITRHDGILYAVDAPKDGGWPHAGDKSWAEIVTSAIDLFAKVPKDQDSLRISIGGHVVVLMRNEVATVAVVVVKGHPVVKSVVRMVRKRLRDHAKRALTKIPKANAAAI